MNIHVAKDSIVLVPATFLGAGSNIKTEKGAIVVGINPGWTVDEAFDLASRLWALSHPHSVEQGGTV